MKTPPLPVRDGVGPSCVALPPGAYATIVQCLGARFPRIAGAEWEARIQRAEVVDEHGIAVTMTRPHQAGLKVYYYRSVAAEARLPFVETVLYQDEHLVVADKPHFMATTPTGSHLQETLLVRLKRRLGIDTLAPVHRIDRETAGVVLFSVDPATRGRYQRLFAERQVKKGYECIARWREGLPEVHASHLADDPAHFMRVIETAGAPNSETGLRPVEIRMTQARYALTPVTGKRHQLRVHCAALGIPIVGDRIYPRLLPHGTDDFRNPLRLLARTLEFVDPVTGRARRFESGYRLDWPDAGSASRR